MTSATRMLEITVPLLVDQGEACWGSWKHHGPEQCSIKWELGACMQPGEGQRR